MALLNKQTASTTLQRSTQVLPAALRGSSCFRAVNSRSSSAPALSARQQRRLVAARATAEEKGEWSTAAFCGWWCCWWWCVQLQCFTNPPPHNPYHCELQLRRCSWARLPLQRSWVTTGCRCAGLRTCQRVSVRLQAAAVFCSMCLLQLSAPSSCTANHRGWRRRRVRLRPAAAALTQHVCGSGSTCRRAQGV